MGVRSALRGEKASSRAKVGAGRRLALPVCICVMRDLEAVWKLARADLVVPAEGGGNDIFLWEHCVRVAKSAQYLSRLPEAQAREPDSLALLAAALFHEAGWISRWRAGEIERHEILLGSPSESIVVESIRVMQQALHGVIPAQSLTRACETIRFRTAQTPEPIEGQILIEADNLEEFGLGFLCALFWIVLG